MAWTLRRIRSLFRRRREVVYRLLVRVLTSGLRRVCRWGETPGSYVVGSEVVYYEVDGMRFRYVPGDYGCTGNLDWGTGPRDESVSKLLEISPRGGVMYDIGAHGGAYTICANRYRPDLTVFSFEPLPNDLIANLKLGSIDVSRVFPVALGDQAGEAYMEDRSRSSNYVKLESDQDGCKVQIVKLDDFVSSNALPLPDVIKIDIEGLEFFALRGAAEVLRRAQPLIICEINRLYARYYHDLGEFVRYMESLGYQLHSFRDGELKPIVVAPEALVTVEAIGPTTGKNYWFIPRAKPNGVRDERTHNGALHDCHLENHSGG